MEDQEVASVNTDDPDAALYWAERRVLKIQTKLYRWACADPGGRFDDLFNLVADPAFLLVAWDRVRSNRGARSAGVDRRTASSIALHVGVEDFLDTLRSALKDRSFRPLPLRERMIPKSGGKQRRLGIATITDRVVQASLKLVLEPIFEADFLPCSYGFRPNRRAHDAVAEVRHFTSHSYEWVLEGDIKACLDPWSYCSLADYRGFEEGFLWGVDLDTQAFSASGAGEHGAQLAALDFLQHGLAGDAEGSAGVVEGEPAVGGVVDEHCA
jgi:RNA-directed DNA polymerase